MKIKSRVIMWQFTLKNLTAIIKYQGNQILIDYFVVFFLICWKDKWLYSNVVAVSFLPKLEIGVSFC